MLSWMFVERFKSELLYHALVKIFNVMILFLRWGGLIIRIILEQLFDDGFGGIMFW